MRRISAFETDTSKPTQNQPQRSQRTRKCCWEASSPDRQRGTLLWRAVGSQNLKWALKSLFLSILESKKVLPLHRPGISGICSVFLRLIKKIYSVPLSIHDQVLTTPKASFKRIRGKPLELSWPRLVNLLIEITLQHPTSHDGASVNELILDCPPLDRNSVYCNLLQCSHFAETSIIAKSGAITVGFSSGYRVPTRPEVLFVWQVAVSREARGQGLASRLLRAQLDAKACQGVRFIETTITKDNAASRALFRAFAEKTGGTIEEFPHFDRVDHFQDKHDSEFLIRIGPFSH